MKKKLFSLIIICTIITLFQSFATIKFGTLIGAKGPGKEDIFEIYSVNYRI